MATTKKNDGFFSGLTVADVFNSYVGLETKKVQARIGATAQMQKNGLNAPSLAQNPQATTSSASGFKLSPKVIGIGTAGLGVLLAVLKITKVI